MRVREAKERDKKQWNSLVFSSPGGSFLQSWEWGEVQKKLGVSIWRFIAEGGQGIEAAMLVLRRDLPMGRCWLYVPRGPVIPTSTSSFDVEKWQLLQENILELAEKERAVFIRNDPAWEELPHFAQAAPSLPSAGKVSQVGFSFRKSERQVQPQHTLILDLSLPEDELLAQMKSKTRYNVRLAERKGVKVRFSQDVADIDAFLQLSRGVSDRSGFSYHPDEYYRAILSGFSKVNKYSEYSTTAELAIAEFEGKALAAHLMIYAGDTATYAHGASGVTHRKLMAPQFLYWQTILQAKKKGARTFDFFGVAPPESDRDHPWAGVTRVKEGFGGSRVNYVGALDLVLDEVMYTAFNMARRVRSFLK